MTDRFNTIAGWCLFSGIVALGLSIASGMYYRADKHNRPEEMGYPVAVAETTGGAEGPTLAELLAVADPAKGKAVFAKCGSCHTAEQGGINGIGPNLFGVVGEAMGSGRGGFAFSSALAGHGGNWTFENLDAWLKNPRGFADGTKMTFAGLPSAEDRANVIAYLNSMGSNLPLPAVEAKPAAEEPAAGEAEATGEPAAAPAK